MNVFSSIYSNLIDKIRRYQKHKKAFNIGYSGGKGNNIYITFGSDKTITKDAEDSYKRYAMAMKHYKEEACDKESFIQGYNKAKER